MRTIEYSSIVESNLTEVWNAWTTNEGVRSFFAPDSNIELKIGGSYELYFDLAQEEGFRGSEGMKVLSFLPEHMFSFEWNHPPILKELRDRKTWVVIEFRELDDELCEIVLTHAGFEEGSLWDQSYKYFHQAWRLVLDRFERSMCMGAIDWSVSACA